MNPVVSVIILTYNQEDTIARTIDSVLTQQDAPEYEIIIGEDCSKDRTRKICERYAGIYPGKIRLMPKEDNKGLTRNYRDCFLEAKGRYIADCPGDDLWLEPHFLKNAVEVLDSHSDISIAFGGLEGEPTIPRGRIDGKEMLVSMLNETGIPPIVLSASLFRREIVDAENERMRIFGYFVEDYPLLACLLNAGDAYSLSGELLRYSRSNGSLSRPSNDTLALSNAIRALDMRLELAGIYGIPKGKLKEFIRKNTDYIAAVLHRHPDPYLSDYYENLIRLNNIPISKKARIYRALYQLINR